MNYSPCSKYITVGLRMKGVKILTAFSASSKEILLCVSFLNFFILNVYLFWRETKCKHGRGRERGRHRIRSRLQALSCQHRARHGARTHEPWDHDLSRSQTLNRLSHPGAPPTESFLKITERVRSNGCLSPRYLLISTLLSGPKSGFIVSVQQVAKGQKRC